MFPDPPPLRTVARAAAVALGAGLIAVVALAGLSSSGIGRALEIAALGIGGIVAIATVVGWVSLRLGGWRPASEEEFELIVQRSERLAREGLAAEPTEGEFMALDPLDDDDFAELVRDALDDLPDLLRNALRHVAVVISDGGRRRGAYGLYQGGQSRRDDVHDRIIIFRDTLRRDFGHDPDMLRDQVTRVVRHELAHHVGFDELGVRGLGL
jgi:predicted Zn-dependent protease with MMP-like domain